MAHKSFFSKSCHPSDFSAPPVRPSTRGAYGATAGGLVTLETYEPAAIRPDAWPRHRLTRLDIVIAAVLIGAALLARWPLIERGETLLHSDESIVGLMAQDIAAGRRLPVYFYGQRYMGALEAYVVAALSPCFDRPIIALRFGPACFFALLTAAQYLMLTRWFGRRGGLLGAAVLLAGSPMFAQWSISARGGYIEILLLGTLLLWAYSEWFGPAPNQTARVPRVKLRRFLLGTLIGGGLWINPAIVLFILPVAVHALLNRPLATLQTHPRLAGSWGAFIGTFRNTTLPVALLAGVILLNSIWAVWVEENGPRTLLLLGLVSPRIAGLILTLGVGAALFAVFRPAGRRQRFRALLQEQAPLILGTVVGATPAVLYVLGHVLGGKPLDPSVPLGFRPLWEIGDTIIYLLSGLPLLLGADARPFLELVCVGGAKVFRPLDILQNGLVAGANALALGALLTGGILLLREYRAELGRLFRLEPGRYSPAVFLLTGLGGAVGLYLLGGCSFDFNTIRYLIPAWAFLPGLVAAVFTARRSRFAACLAPPALIAAWIVGQVLMHAQLGHPHPLRPVATALVRESVPAATAELFDAHVLSYLTEQRCQVAEFNPFWSRLAHFRTDTPRPEGTAYIVETQGPDRTWDWLAGCWPGMAPPETQRSLWPRLRQAMLANPANVLSRRPLGSGYELIRLREPLPEKGANLQGLSPRPQPLRLNNTKKP